MAKPRKAVKRIIQRLIDAAVECGAFDQDFIDGRQGPDELQDA